MKAASFVFMTIQKPLTVFGLPVWLLVSLACASGAVLVIFVVAGYMAISLPAAITAFAIGWYKLFQQVRADHHFGNIIIAVPRFWLKRGRLAKGSAQLIAGLPAEIKKGSRSHIRLPISAPTSPENASRENA